MPPNGNTGASRKSYLPNGYGTPNQLPSQCNASVFIAISESASASLSRDARTNMRTFVVGAPRAITRARDTVAYGPAAKAIRYVLSGRVSAK